MTCLLINAEIATQKSKYWLVKQTVPLTRIADVSASFKRTSTETWQGNYGIRKKIYHFLFIFLMGGFKI